MSTSKLCQSTPASATWVPSKHCSHFRFKMANLARFSSRVFYTAVYGYLLSMPKGTYKNCSMMVLLANSPATAYMHCWQKWALESSCAVWLQYHMTLCSSMVQLCKVGGGQRSWPGSIAHMPELNVGTTSIPQLLLLIILSFFFWAVMSCTITSLHHRTDVYSTRWSSCDNAT